MQVAAEAEGDRCGRRQTAHQLDLHLPRKAYTVGQVRHALDALLARFHVSTDCRERAALAVGEACANTVEHATGASEYHVTARVDDGHCQVCITDDGPGFHPGGTPLVPPSTSAETGRGLHLIAALADQFDVRTWAGHGTRVRLTIDLAFTPH
jgi:serine/threonine-protein kinase RsbW